MRLFKFFGRSLRFMYTDTVTDNHHLSLPDAASTSAAGMKKTEPMCGLPSTSQQPVKDTSRAGEEEDKWSPVSSPKKPAAGEILIQLALINAFLHDKSKSINSCETNY